ncbi:hypothetical protein [Rickettsia endosymbiont of Aspidapion aeneum]|uniref:hypothetical protein n=1 Tax=Rickettsia endosymbiont of Aspidapion aeneum TaxID=3066247 RepID=UPI00313E714D
MKWQAIAGVTSQLNEEARGYLVRKFEKDAAVQIPDIWSDFINDTTKHLHQSQSNLEIANDEKTGSLTALTQFDELHPDFLENNKPFLKYTLDKYDQRAAGYLANVKNPITKKILQSKIGDYRVNLADKVSNTEVRLIDGKRHNMAIEAIEKSKSATYDNPQLYESHLQDCSIAVNSLSLLPQEKEQLLHQAKEELAGAAAMGVVAHSPEAIIRGHALPPEAQPLWQQHLSFEQRIKLENQANNLIHHKQLMLQQEVKSSWKPHLASILETGQGIKAIDNLLRVAFSSDDPNLYKLKQDEAVYKQAFLITQHLKTAPLSEGDNILAAIAPKAGDLDYDSKERMHHTLVKYHHEQMRLAGTDPAAFVEQLFKDEIPQNLSMEQRYILRKQLQEQKGIPSYAQKYLINAESNAFLRKLNSGDINEIKNTVNSIIGLRDDNGNRYGLEVMDELLATNKNDKLALLIHHYAENKLFNRDTAEAFMEMIGANNLFSKTEEKEFTKIIENDENVEKWSNNLKWQNIQSGSEIEQMKHGIKYLAAYYHSQQSLSAEDAVKKAREKLIDKVYMNIENKQLQIPRQIIAGNMIHNLDEDYIEANLVELQRGIINGTVPYDYPTCFGISGEDAIGEEAASRIRAEVLRQGRWKMTPDKKSVYYTYLTKDGSYLPVMAAPNKILKFDLVDLNNPASLERQKQNFLNAISNTPYEN